MNEDDDKKVRGAGVECLDDTIKSLGPAFIDRSLPEIVESITKLLDADLE